MQVQLAARRRADKHEVVLRENESARVEKADGAAGRGWCAHKARPAIPPVCAGGWSSRPSCSICWTSSPAATARAIAASAASTRPPAWKTPVFVRECRAATANTRLGPLAHQLIDGVFVPDGRRRPGALDSAGHTFDGFPQTDGRHVRLDLGAGGGGQAGGTRRAIRAYWIYAMGPRRAVHARRPRAARALHANSGITFNLEAMRQMHHGVRPARFRAVAGLADAQPRVSQVRGDGMADIWVFVDGR